MRRICKVDNTYLENLSDFQKRLSLFVTTEDRTQTLDTVGGVDVFYHGGSAYACACVVEYPSCYLKELVTVQDTERFPYISGYLSFREGPVMLKAVSSLERLPDCLVVDGNGLLHPYSMGLATFLGIFLQIPVIGCAKSLAVGKYSPVGNTRGDYSFIYYKRKRRGLALRSKEGVKEIFISVGWGIELLRAKDIILEVSRYRIPEPLRIAHQGAKRRDKIKLNFLDYTVYLNN